METRRRRSHQQLAVEQLVAIAVVRERPEPSYFFREHTLSWVRHPIVLSGYLEIFR